MGLRKGKSEARRNTHHAWGRRKKKDVRMENIRRARRNIQTWFVRTTNEEERDWILLPRGESIENLPLSRFTALYGKFVPLVSPTVRKQSAYDASIVETFDGISIETSIQSRPSGPIFPFLSFSILRIHLSTRMLIRDAVSMCHRSFVRQRVNLSRVKWKRKKGISPSPFGNKSGGTMMVELDGSRLRILLFLPWFHVFESYIEHASCNLWKIEIILKILELEIRR